MRSLLAIGAVLTLSVGLVMGGEFGAIIKKIDGDKFTIAKRSKTDPKGGEEMTLSAKDAKVVKGKFNKETMKVEAGEALEGGLKNEAIKEGAFISVVTDADNKNITEIRVLAGRKKKDS